jgi:hypothetical protein
MIKVAAQKQTPKRHENTTPQRQQNTTTATPKHQQPERQKSEKVKQIRQKAVLRSAAQNDLSVLIAKRQDINKEAAELKRKSTQVKRRQLLINAAIETKLSIVTKLDKEYQDELSKVKMEEL